MYFSDSVNCISQVQKVHSPQYWEKVIVSELVRAHGTSISLIQQTIFLFFAKRISLLCKPYFSGSRSGKVDSPQYWENQGVKVSQYLSVS